MASLNKVILVGCLTDDPVVRDIKEDRRIVGTMVGLAIETARSWFDRKSGEIKQGVELHRVVVTQDQLAAFARTLSKGEEVYLEGELLTHFWRNELQEWQGLTQILLWQPSNQISRFDKKNDELNSMPSQNQILDAAKEAKMKYYASHGPLSREVLSYCEGYDDDATLRAIGS